MVILRPTRKLQDLVPPAAEPDAPSDTALGDWYLNRLVVDRQPLLLLVSSRSLLSILIPARDVRTLPARLPDVVGARLQRFGIRAPLVDAETKAMAPVAIAKTSDRSVLGVMVDFAKDIPYYLEINGWNESTLPDVEDKLAETPCYAARRFEELVIPEDRAPSLLAAKWHAG
jgi:Domain of unknown function (DUF6933)